jgi:hypothetical protein
MVSLPTGNAVTKNADLTTIDLVKTILEMQERTFSGYAAVCIQGTGGFEEGIVLFDSGKVVGCSYEYYKHSKMFEGSAAFQRVLNASAAKNGVVDIISLTPQQVQLVLALNEKMVFVPDQKQLEKVSVSEFSPSFEQEAAGGSLNPAQDAVQSRSELLKKFKLGEMIG